MNTPQPAPAQPLGRISSCPQARGMVGCIWGTLAGCVTSAESLNFSETPSLFLAEPRKAPQRPPAHGVTRRKKAGPNWPPRGARPRLSGQGCPPAPSTNSAQSPLGPELPVGAA